MQSLIVRIAHELVQVYAASERVVGIPGRRAVVLFLTAAGVAACATAPLRPAGESQVRCIHRLYDYPARAVPFQTAASECASGSGGNGPVDLTGDPYYQTLASSLNIPYVTHDPRHDGAIVLTGSRVAQPTDRPVSPNLQLR